ncbi:MAG: HlyC/CorC family transporter [Sphingobacteriales bacterium]|nr:MAG: HlyC/CorC family transporter [Sphingobacteriales bacterium]
MEIPVLLIVFFVSILLICFFAGIEVAFGSANKLSIELSKKQGTYSGKTWGNFAEHPTRFIGTILLAINIVLVIYGLLVGQMITPFWEWIKKIMGLSEESFVNYISYFRLFVETVLASAIILSLIVLTRAYFKAKSNSLVSNGIISYFARFFYWLFAGLSGFMISASEWILQYIFNVKLSDKKEVFTKIDLEHFLQQSKGTADDENSELNKELFENALSISETKLRECLVPRKEIVSVPLNSSIETIKDKFIETRLSKLVVCDNDIDNIVGYIHQLDLFKSPATVEDIMLPIAAVPESMSVSGLLDKFSKDGKTIAWVIDEFGGTAGIVTMEDLLEEIFGEIKDEYDDVDELVNKQLSTTEFLFSGRLELDFITEKYQLEFIENESAETLSGFIIEQNEGSIPQQKDRIIAGNYQFDILNVSGTRIETVKLKLLK